MACYNLIIAGCRDYTPEDWEVDAAVHEWLEGEGAPEYKINLVISGMAAGADMAGWNWAVARDIDVSERPADWKKHGKVAGKIRNIAMADEEDADGLIAFWDGMSPGTAHMIAYATMRGLKVLIKRIPR